MTHIIIVGKMFTKYQILGKPTFYDTLVWSMGKHDDHDIIKDFVDQWFDIHKYPVNTDPETILREDFPFEECHTLLGGRYFNNTMSYMIAYAILGGATKLSFYGCTFAFDHEKRKDQLENVRQLVAFAKGRGIDIYDFDGVITAEYPEPSGDKDFDG